MVLVLLLAAPARPVRRTHPRVRVAGEVDLRSLLIAGIALLLLPFALDALGLTLKTATDVVIFAIAAMGLKSTWSAPGLGLGHGVWFGLLSPPPSNAEEPESIIGPALGALLIVGAGSADAALVILRRRGVYFSLLTLESATAILAIAFRWTEMTGGEVGLGGGGHAAGLLDDPCW